jgi:hypothetical protein
MRSTHGSTVSARRLTRATPPPWAADECVADAYSASSCSVTAIIDIDPQAAQRSSEPQAVSRGSRGGQRKHVEISSCTLRVLSSNNWL